MNLRTRILLSYGYLIALLVLSAAGAALGFQQIGADIGRLLTENFESVRAAMMMLDALERQDSAVLGILLGTPGSQELLTKSEQSFIEGLAKAHDHSNLSTEEKVIGEITSLFDSYRKARDTLLAGVHERPLLDYERETLPRFEEVKASVLELLEINHQAMVAADQGAQRKANLRAIVHGLLVAVALLSLGFLSREMRRNILDRMEELKSVAQAIASGDRSRRASVQRADELGLVARQLNAILDRERQTEGKTEAQLVTQRRWILGLLRHFDRPAALVSSAGDLIASTLTPGEEETVRDALPDVLPTCGKEQEYMQDTASGRRIRLEAVMTEEHRPVGWLVTLDAGEVKAPPKV